MPTRPLQPIAAGLALAGLMTAFGPTSCSTSLSPSFLASRPCDGDACVPDATACADHDAANALGCEVTPGHPDSQDSGGAPDGSDVDGSIDAGVGIEGGADYCKANLPATIPSPCTPRGDVLTNVSTCELGTSPVLDCNELIECRYDRAYFWQILDHQDDSACRQPRPSICPASSAAVPRGAACSGSDGTVCDYPDGRCECTTGVTCPSPTSACPAPTAAHTWRCPSPGPGCPVPRPLIGSLCGQTDLVCDYGASAGITGGTVQTCTGGYWRLVVTASPDGGSACVDLQNDPTNCGACGTTCAFGCQASHCMPGTVLASGQAAPWGIAVDATSVYWTNSGDGTVMKAPIGGGTPSLLSSGGATPMPIALDTTNLYWGDAGRGVVMKVPLGGGPASAVACCTGPLVSIALDGTNVYWTKGGVADGAVMKAPLLDADGGAGMALFSAPSLPGGIAVAASNVFWTDADDSTVKMMPSGGGAVTTLAQAATAVIAVDATNVYWVGNGYVATVPFGGGTPTEVAGSGVDWSDTPQGIIVDATNVYWTSTNGNIEKVPIGGGSVTRLATGQSRPRGIAVDATSVYWVNSGDGTVRKAPK